METIGHFFAGQWMGAPVWAWLAIFGLGALNEWVQRTKKVKAQSVLQATGDALKRTPFYLVPVLRQVIDGISTPVQPALAQPEQK